MGGRLHRQLRRALADAEHWNGSSWRIVDSPSPGSPYNALNDVTAAGPNDVWAVGGAPYLGTSVAPFDSAPGYTLHWDGRAWFVVAGPPDRTSNSTRSGVVAVSSTELRAVGQFDAWRWDGSRWSVPAFGAQSAIGVDAAGSAHIWAVGSYFTGSSEGAIYGPFPIGHRWNGSAWQQRSAVDLGVGAFQGVTARSPADVLAVGYAAFAARWDGSAWRRVPAANANPAPNTNRSEGNVLLGVDSAGGATWAVGFFYDGTGSGTDYGDARTLIERLAC